MSNYLKTLGACCTPCKDPVYTKVPGEKGDTGAAGTNGIDGLDAFTTVTTQFLMPAVSGTVTAEVGSTLWMAAGQPLFIEFAGTLLVNSIVDDTHVTLLNPGYNGNAAPTDPIPVGAKVTPGGRQGSSGTSSAAVASVAIPNGVQSYTLPSQAFGFLPTSVVCTIRKPAAGMTLLVNVVEGSITADTFQIWLTAPTPSVGYLLDYIALP